MSLASLSIVILLALQVRSYFHSERRYREGYADGYLAARQYNPHGIPPLPGDGA